MGGKNRTKCIRRRGVELSKFVRGDKKNEAPDTSNAELEDARAFMYRCMKKKFLTKTDKDCRKEFIKRLKQTRQCDPSTGPISSRSCPMARCSTPPKGCKLVDKYAMTSSGHCCPRQCYYEDANGKPCSDSPKEEPKEEPKKNPKKIQPSQQKYALTDAQLGLTDATPARARRPVNSERAREKCACKTKNRSAWTTTTKRLKSNMLL